MERLKTKPRVVYSKVIKSIVNCKKKAMYNDVSRERERGRIRNDRFIASGLPFAFTSIFFTLLFAPLVNDTTNFFLKFHVHAHYKPHQQIHIQAHLNGNYLKASELNFIHNSSELCECVI